MTLKIIKIFAFIIITTSNTTILAENFICGADLNNNGDVLDAEEQASCQNIDSEQFCSVGAVSCNADVEEQYNCSLDSAKYNNENSCNESCKQISSGTQQVVLYDTNNYYVKLLTQIINPPQIVYLTHGVGYIGFLNGSHYFKFPRGTIYNIDGVFTKDQPDNILIGAKKGSGVYYCYDCNMVVGNFEIYEIIKTESTPTTTQGSCNLTTNTNYSCPIAGNSCLNNNGIMQCSPNKCIDIDVDKPIDTKPPAVMEVDNGTRNSDGACMDKASMFSGRNLSCAYKGLTKNCCKDKGVVFRDSTGSIAEKTASSLATSYAWHIAKAGYAAYVDAYGFFGDAAFAAGHAADAANTAMSNFTINPAMLAASVAIQVVMEMMACGQEDAEAAMLNGSGYCHYVGDYCSKKIKFIGCIKKSKSYCCFNSKLARIIQEQGRPQLGMTFGSAESPSCSGFTPQQFQSIDFSKIDMSEYYGDIKAKADSIINQSVSDTVNNYYDKIGKDYAK
jgi:conjugal transfer mating pair stabilization protein TraN